jgi:Lon protease-like protein
VKLDIDALLATFPQRVPVFPLGEVVLFPGAVLPLHVFEPRYRKMIGDAMAAEGLIALALLKQCDRHEYQDRPPFFPTVCVGRIVHHEPLGDGRANIALLGLSAGRVVVEPDDGSPHPYPTALVELLDDVFVPAPDHERKVADAFAQSVPGEDDLSGLKDQLEEFLRPERIPAALVNTCALTAPILPQDKLDLLVERDVSRRLDRLLELLARPWRWN